MFLYNADSTTATTPREAWFYGALCGICGELISNETVFHKIFRF